nr:6-pyruvoyl-tetrahydropterin synthase-related protein [uncultured Eisenbergiella sp.]
MINKLKSNWKLIALLLLEALVVVWVGMSWEKDKWEAVFDGNSLIHGEADAFVSSPGVDLSKGTYQVVIEYEANEAGQTYSAASDKPSYWVVMGRQDVALDPVKNVESFTIWIDRATLGYHIDINYNGSGHFLVKNIRIVETNGYFGMRLGIGVFLLLFLNAGYGAAAGKWLGRLSQKQKNIAAGIFVLAFLSSIPLFSSYLYSGHDLTFHLLRIEGIKDALRIGQFPVRIQPDWFRGYGYASSIFYGDIFLYIPAVIRLLGFPLQTAYKIYIILVNLVTCFIAFSCFKRIVKSDFAAFIGCVLYVLSPYRLGNIYIRGAVGEYTAMAFFPFLVTGLYLLFSEASGEHDRKKGRNFLAAGFTGIMQSHMISCEMTIFFTLLLCLLFIKRVFKKARWKELLKGAFITAALNLWFLIPFLDYSMQGRFGIVEPGGIAGIQTYNAFANQLFDFFPNGIGSAYSISERMQNPLQMPLTTGFVLTGTIFAFAFYVWNHKKEKAEERRTGTICIGFGVLALWMATTGFPWDALAGLGSVPSLFIGNLQYGWRFLSVASVLLAAAACCLVRLIEKKEDKTVNGMILSVYLVLGILCGGWLLSSIMNNSSVMLCRDRSELHEDDVTSLEYIPKGTDRAGFDETLPAAGEEIAWESYENNHGRIHITVTNRNREESGSIFLPLLNYKGYQARGADGRKLTIENGDNNRVKVIVPPGYQGEIKVSFQEPALWRAGCLISAAALLLSVLSLSCFWQRLSVFVRKKYKN